MIVLLVIVSLVAPYSRPFNLTSPHPEWNTPLAEQTNNVPIFGSYLFFRFYRAYLASEFPTFLYIPLPY